MAVKPNQEEIYDSVTSTDSLLVKALHIYLQGLVVAVFGFLLFVMTFWLPLDYVTTGFMFGFLIGSYVLGCINSRVTRRFWSQDYRFSNLTLLGQGVVLMFITIIVLSSAASVFVIQIANGPQIDPLFQMQLGFVATLIAPPFFLARPFTAALRA